MSVTYLIKNIFIKPDLNDPDFFVKIRNKYPSDIDYVKQIKKLRGQRVAMIEINLSKGRTRSQSLEEEVRILEEEISKNSSTLIS